MNRLISLLSLLSLLVFAGSVQSAIVYNLDRSIGDGTVTGYIQTDGTLGMLTVGNILDWSLTLTAPNLKGGSPDLISASQPGSAILLRGDAVFATALDLTYDFDNPDGDYLFLQGASDNYWCLNTSGCVSSVYDGTELIAKAVLGSNTPAQTELRSGSIVFASAVPVPAAAWLFGSGLITLLAAARRRATGQIHG